MGWSDDVAADIANVYATLEDMNTVLGFLCAPKLLGRKVKGELSLSDSWEFKGKYYTGTITAVERGTVGVELDPPLLSLVKGKEPKRRYSLSLTEAINGLVH